MKKPTEAAMMDVIKRSGGSFAIFSYKTVTIKGERYNMKAVKEVLESLHKKKKLKRAPKGKDILSHETYYLPSLTKKDIWR